MSADGHRRDLKSRPDGEAGAALADNQKKIIAQAEGLRVVNRQADMAVRDAIENYESEEMAD